MLRTFLMLAAFFGFTGVGLGAFSAHALKARLSPEHLAVFQTGVHYQQIHALALLGVALLSTHVSGSLVGAAGWFFTAGILLFSGSLYLLTLTGTPALGMITPIGGVAFLAGWLLLFLVAFRLA